MPRPQEATTPNMAAARAYAKTHPLNMAQAFELVKHAMAADGVTPSKRVPPELVPELQPEDVAAVAAARAELGF